MLIYNFQKEFLGIDEKDLKTLGFNTLSELRAEVTDFADLFVKTPGYVHNFKHVHWIDFINYADVSEESKVLINVNAKTFKATLAVSPIYLIDNPSSPAYMIHLNHLRPLSKAENANLSNDVLDRELPKVEPQEAKVFTPAAEVSSVVADAYDESPEDSMDKLTIDEQPSERSPLLEEEPLEVYETPKMPSIPQIEIPSDTMLDVDDLSLDVFEEEASSSVTETTPAPKTVKKEIIDEEWDNGYQYDPHIASKELGLPLDLIEEFIQDFIAQAKEFKPDIYSSIEEGDVDNVKILSHKLKGVAANLRIEDAHEVLSAVSATSDMDVIHENLDTFYKIIAKLAGEPAKQVVMVEEKVAVADIEIEDEPLELTMKDEVDNLISPDFNDESSDEEAFETLTIKDEDVPDKIEMPELMDDDFLDITLDEDDVEDENDDQDENAKEEFHYSKSEAAKEIGIDETSFNELFDDFIAESHIILKTINTAIANNDLQIAQNEAMKFKGMSDNMRLNEFTSELETLIHTTDKDAITQAAQKIDEILTKISEIGA